MNVLTQNLPRLFTGLALLALLADALYLGGDVLAGLLILVALLGVNEFYSMFWTGREKLPERVLGILLTLGFGLLTWLHPQAGMLPFCATFLALSLFFLVRWSRNPSASYADTAIATAGLAYVPMLLLPALTLNQHEQILLVCITIFADSAAYFFGVRFGKHKIWPKVSPGKSLEGSLAGLVSSVLVCVALGLAFGSASITAFIGLGLILGVMSQLGDFFESALKRAHGVKDSGHLLPGHGGILDRIDSLLFVIPSYLLCSLFIKFF